MRNNYLLKSKIKKYLRILLILYVIFFILDLTKVNYKVTNIRLITFDNLNLNSSLNRTLYGYFNKIYTNFLLIGFNQKLFWDIDKTDRSNIKNKPSIESTKLQTTQIQAPEKLLGNWYRSHGNNNSNRFSNLKNINKDNISKLSLAWIYNSNKGKGKKIDIQCNPIAIDGIIYTPVVGGFIVAIDGYSGKELWRSVQLNYDVARRGLLYWKDDNSNKERIFFNNGSKLIALDAKTGKKDKSFGKKGYVRTGYSKITPSIYKDKIVIASWDKNLEVYDVNNGKLEWKYYFGDNKRSRSGGIKYNNLKGGNPWGGISLDDERGIVYVTTGNPSKYFDGTERPGLNYNSNSIIAISIEKKKQLWSFQETFHDIWNLDLPAPPILTSIKHKGVLYDVVIAVTKRGNTIVLDRLTGKSPFKIDFKLAPKSSVSGEKTALHQLDFKLPEPFSKSEFSKKDITNISNESKIFIEQLVQNSNFGFFEPANFEKDTIVFNFHGGGEWMGASVNHDNQTMYVNSNEITWITKLIKQNNKTISTFKRMKDQDGYPGNKPPWGKITSLNLNNGQINWSIPFGTYKELESKNNNEATGTENFGGVTGTASGLLFATGTLDSMFYVFDSVNGEVLFKYKLPFIGSSPPTTYLSKNEQFIIVQSSGSYSLQQGYPEINKYGDALVAFKIN